MRPDVEAAVRSLTDAELRWEMARAREAFDLMTLVKYPHRPYYVLVSLPSLLAEKAMRDQARSSNGIAPLPMPDGWE